MATISRIDWDIIDARVNHVNIRHELKSLSIAFLWLVLEQYFPGTESDRISSITDGGEDKGIDAIHIIESDSHAEIFVFQSKYRENQSSTNRTVNEAEALRVSDFIANIFDKSSDISDTGNFRLDECVKRIWQIHEKGMICRYKVVICSNDQGLSHSAKKILDRLHSTRDQVTYETYNHNDLIRDLASDQFRRDSGSLQVVGKEIYERIDGDVRGAIASIDANSFIDLICMQDRQTIKRYLFDDNLRIYLGSSGGFNSSIIQTATSEDNYLFWYLNNGITITC